MRGTVVNTPGYYYAISYWLSALVMILVHGCGKKDVWKYVYGVAEAFPTTSINLRRLL